MKHVTGEWYRDKAAAIKDNMQQTKKEHRNIFNELSFETKMNMIMGGKYSYLYREPNTFSTQKLSFWGEK